jgi:hypothetical protein
MKNAAAQGIARRPVRNLRQLAALRSGGVPASARPGVPTAGIGSTMRTRRIPIHPRPGGRGRFKATGIHWDKRLQPTVRFSLLDSFADFSFMLLLARLRALYLPGRRRILQCNEIVRSSRSAHTRTPVANSFSVRPGNEPRK